MARIGWIVPLAWVLLLAVISGRAVADEAVPNFNKAVKLGRLRVYSLAHIPGIKTAANAQAVTLRGGGSKRTDCLVELMTNGVGFPAGKSFTGATCADGVDSDAWE